MKKAFNIFVCSFCFVLFLEIASSKLLQGFKFILKTKIQDNTHNLET